MIKKFFHGLSSLGVSYILISGQATVLYGAATFSEDIDLWVKPSVDNWNKFMKFMSEINARIYKLTPSTSMEFIKKGHGFHFQLIEKNDKQTVWFLDIMGVVPRIGDFETAFKNVIYYETDWGKLPVLGIKELVEIKKTRRLEDYAIISNLVRIYYESIKKINSENWKWILMNSFEIEDLFYFLNSNHNARNVAKKLSRPCISLCLKALSGKKHKEECVESASREIVLEIESLRKKDREYWEDIINQLKELKKENKLLVQGTITPSFVI